MISPKKNTLRAHQLTEFRKHSRRTFTSVFLFLPNITGKDDLIATLKERSKLRHVLNSRCSVAQMKI